MHARRRQPLVHLGLVGTGSRYRPPLDLRRPELAAAFAAGRRDRDAGRRDVWMGDEGDRLPTRDEVEAYALGHATAVEAPPPLAVWASLFALDVVATSYAASHQPLRRHPATALAVIVPAIVHVRVEQRAGRRRARRLGLTPETAPLPGAPPGTIVQLAVATAYGLATRTRDRASPVPSGPVYAASLLVREFERRRSWQAAMRQAASR